MERKKQRHEFWRNTLSNTLGTITGIIVTFGTTAWMQHREQRAMERTAALMVIHNLDNFCDRLATEIEDLEAEDSLNTRVCQLYPDRLDQMADSTLQLFVENLLSRNFVATDETADNIFSTNISTWKDIKESKFVEQGGKSFSIKRKMTELRAELDDDRRRVYDTVTTTILLPCRPQTTRETVARVLRTPALRSFIQKLHEYYLGGMQIGLMVLRDQNAKNKQLMSVTDEELQQFGDNRERKDYTSDE